MSSLAAGAALIFGPKVKEALTQRTDPIIESLIEGANSVLGGELLVTKITNGYAEIGLLPKSAWLSASQNPEVLRMWREDGKRPPAFVSFVADLYIEMTANKDLFLKAITMSEKSRKGLEDMQAVSLLGGGDGDPLHAWVALGDPPRVVYTKDGGNPLIHIMEPLSRDHTKPTPVHITVSAWIPQIIEADIRLVFQQAASEEVSSRVVATVQVAGLPTDERSQLVWSGSNAAVQPLDTAEIQRANFQFDQSKWPKT